MCGGAHFQRDCNARKSTGKQSSGKGKQSKSWSKSEGKGKNTEKGAKELYKGKTSKPGLSGLEHSKSETSSETQESAQTRLTDNFWFHDGWSCDEWNDGWSCDELNHGWSCDEWNDGWSSVGWRAGCEQTCDNSASSFSLGSLDPNAMRSPKRFEWVKMNLDTGAAVNTFPLNFVQMQEMEDSIGLPVVNGFLMVELGSFKDTMKTVCSDV